MDTALETVGQVASSINIKNMNQKVSFSVISSDGNVIYSSLTEALNKNILSSIKEQQKGWALKKTEYGVFVQAIRPALYQNNTFYIETIRDVTYIFNGQKLQYKTLLNIMAVIIVFGGLFTLIISKLLLKRVVSLSRVTKDISNGNLSKRAAPGGSDEIAGLLYTPAI